MDTVRSRNELVATFADNNSGSIDEQDLRDLIVSSYLRLDDAVVTADSLTATLSGYASAAALATLSASLQGKADQSDVDELEDAVDALYGSVASNIASALASKADASALTALAASVATKAGQADLDALGASVATLATDLEAIELTPGPQGPKGETGATGPAGSAASNLITSVAGRTGAIVLGISDITGLAADLSTRLTNYAFTGFLNQYSGQMDGKLNRPNSTPSNNNFAHWQYNQVEDSGHSASSFATAVHTHTIANVTGLQALLDVVARRDEDNVYIGLQEFTNGVQVYSDMSVAGPLTVTNTVTANAFVGNGSGLTGIVATPSAHTHAITDVSGLVAALAGKANTSHTHSFADIGGLSEYVDDMLVDYAEKNHTHAISDVTGLQTALDTKLSANSSGANLGTTTIAEAHTLGLTSNADVSPLIISGPNLVSKAAFNLILPVGDGLSNGKAFQISGVGESISRVVFASNGSIALGDGTNSRDTIIGRRTQGGWLINNKANVTVAMEWQSNGTSVANVSATGVMTAASFAGSGSGLTAIPQSAVTSLTSDLAAKASISALTAYLHRDGGVMSEGGNIGTGTTTGTKIGTATTQKIGFYNATPIVQPNNTTDLRQSLINLGLYASGGATPLNLNGGTLKAGKMIGGVSTIAYAASVTLNPATTSASVYKLTLTGNLTLSIANGVEDGETIRVRLIQDATGGRTLTMGGTNIAYSSDLPQSVLVLSTGAGKTDYLGFEWSGTKWVFMALNRGV